MNRPETDQRLADLALEVRELAASPEHDRRRKLWADVVNLRTTRPAVNFYMYQSVWAAEIAGDDILSTDPLAREIETQLAFKLWRARHLHDDRPVDPSVRLPAARPPQATPFPWGMEMAVERTDESGSYRERPAIVRYEDIENLRAPFYEIDRAATTSLVEKARALMGDVLPVVVMTDELHWGPFEYAVRLRGIENLLYDVYDAPDFVHRLMDTLTEGMITYQTEREAAGGVSAEADSFGHVPYDEVPEGLQTRLKGMWAYVHAQSAASLSPAMYEEFIHPYNCRLAALVGKTYYHGCEDLSKKCRIIRTLPGLRLFHVSPWTPAEPVISELGAAVAYEVHSHPTNVVFGDSLDGIRNELKRIAAAAKGASHVLTLADVETFAGRFDRIAYWAEAASQIACSG
ncbi:MAG: uroporphyrinogen decarboxylase family protein [Planctomycetota bacterium]|jgi:hypothetical protein